jgi:hypothetical protein
MRLTKELLLAAGLAAAWLSGQAVAQSTPGSAERLESTRSTVSKWIASQDLIFRETKEWREGKALLEARIDALQAEIDVAEAKLGDAERILAERRARRAETSAAERKLADGSTHLEQAVAVLETDVRRLHGLLPPVVQDKVALLYARIPEDPATATVSVSERFQNVVGILNEMHKANAEISLVTEIRALADGRPSEVKTVYVGLGQAYFLSAGGESGVGRPTAGGWEWRAANELAQSVSEVIEILENKGKPKFVALPVTLQ